MRDHEAFQKEEIRLRFREEKGATHQKSQGQLFHWVLGEKYVSSLRTIAKGNSGKKAYAQSTTRGTA